MIRTGMALRLVNLCFKNTKLVGTRHLHHSSTYGKFYTNRFYVKKCSRCHSLNSLTLISCFNCSNALSDSDIRFRNLDHICEVSNSRKNMRGPNNVNAISSGIGIDAASGANDVSGSGLENGVNTSVLYRCFDFTIMLNRNPSAFIHLSAFPNGTFYDIKNFRKSHIELINKIADRCTLVLSDVVNGKVDVPGIDRVILGKLKAVISEGAKDKSKSLKEVFKNVVWGFNYPNTHCHVDMHALLPPIVSFNLFKTPFFYPLEKVLGDLKNFGRVRHYSPSQIRQMNEFDEVMEGVKASDMKMREYLSKAQ
ncbi:hypothetical protein MACJ_001279 [Theileria orientalis]|uniref:Uncharacterized protein n=1 Tax=Theileria orientalis TaxID=68886 RepID=A0A976MAK4_THEOR|nr:hypothetical protein MACJ_001279 [Theileria orientalis]